MSYLHIGNGECFRNRRNDVGIGIERREYACLDALPVPLGGIGIDGITVNHLFEPLGRLEKLLLRLAPIAEVIGAVTSVQHAFQATESLIVAQYVFLGFGGFAAFFFQAKHNTNGFCVGFKDVFLIVCHSVPFLIKEEEKVGRYKVYYLPTSSVPLCFCQDYLPRCFPFLFSNSKEVV